MCNGIMSKKPKRSRDLDQLEEFITDIATVERSDDPGSPWENGFNECFNGSLCDKCLNREVFYTLKEVQNYYRTMALRV